MLGAFLRQLKPALIIVATILLSILIGALAFYFTGQTLNVMTLGGIALAGLLGSVAKGVLHRSHVPTLIVPLAESD